MQESSERRTVPQNIVFGSDLLFIPSFKEVGIPQYLSMLGMLTPQVVKGQWVNRDEELLHATYFMFSRERKPKLPIFNDHVWSMKESLLSPVHGLVLDFRKEAMRIDQPWGVYYDEGPVLPVILLPRDEPPPNHIRMTSFHRIGDLLRDFWRMCCIFSRSSADFIRLSEYPDIEGDSWRGAIDTISRFDKPSLSEFEVRAMTTQDANLVEAVQNLRTKDISLRDKLVHLTRLDEDENTSSLQTIGDTYHIYGQAGAIGRNTNSYGNTFNQINNQIEQSIDLTKLAVELAMMRQAMSAEAKEADHFIAIGKVAEAEKAAQSQDRSKAFEGLMGLGKVGGDFASKVGASQTAELLKHYLRMK